MNLISLKSILAIISISLLPFIRKFVNFSQIKLTWFRAQQVLQKYFHLIFLRKFLSFRGFWREWKRWKSLSTRSGEYGGWGRTDHSKSNIFPARFLPNVALRYFRERQRSSYRQVHGVSFEDFHVHFSFIFQVAVNWNLFLGSLRRLHCTNSLKASWLKSNVPSGLNSSVSYVSSFGNFEKHFRTCGL